MSRIDTQTSWSPLYTVRWQLGMLYLIELEVADWVGGPDHTIHHGYTPPQLDIELVEERESLARSPSSFVILEAPVGESSRFSVMLQTPTLDTATPPPKKPVSSSSYQSQGVCNYIINRYHLPRVV
jgi:hypothetical protein